MPPALPLLGHWLALRARGRGSEPGDTHLRTLRRWAEAHGGAFRLLLPRAWLLPGGLGLGLGGGGGRAAGEVVVLSDPAAVHALLALGEDVAPKSTAYYRSLEQVRARGGRGRVGTGAQGSGARVREQGGAGGRRGGGDQCRGAGTAGRPCCAQQGVTQRLWREPCRRGALCQSVAWLVWPPGGR